MSGILTGVRVVDFGHYIAGPLAAVLLADHGADVVRVDRPGTDAGEHRRAAFLQRGKRRITLDLAQQNDHRTARDLVEHADVVIENFRPGVIDRLGLGADSFRDCNPGLIFCSLPGFGAADRRAGLPAWEGTIAAATGNCRVRRGEAPAGWDSERPTYTALPLASNFAAYLAALSIVAALTSRHRTGRGDRIEIPLFNAMFELIGGAGAYPIEQGLRPERPLDSNGSGTYRCRDNRYVQFNPIGASARFLGWLLDSVGETAWAGDDLTSREQLTRRPELSGVLRERLEKLFAGKAAHEWETIAHAAGVPLAMIRTADEWAATQHARESEAVTALDDPVLGRTWMAGRAIRLSTAETPLRARHLPDQDRAEVLAELAELTARKAAGPVDSASDAGNPAAGGSDTDTAPGTDVGTDAGTDVATNDGIGDGIGAGPFSGTRMVDLTQILAGPTAGRLIAELGADVVKINSPQRSVGAHGFVNRGKRSMLLDVESSVGQDAVFWPLVRRSDAVLLNFPSSTADRYGIGYQHVRARKPDVVYVSVSCFGPGGPWESSRGYETQGQAVSGIMERAGRPDRPTVLGPYNALDYGTGTVAALAAALGLYHQRTTGEGQQASTSLAAVATVHQATLLIRPESDGDLPDGDSAPTEPAGPSALGESALQRFYRAADGWFFLGATTTDLPELAAATGLDAAAIAGADSDQARTAMLADAFAGRTVGQWIDRLQPSGIGAHEVVPLRELLTDAGVREQGLSITQHSQEAGEVIMPGVAIAMQQHAIEPGRPAPAPGADAGAVLHDIGLSADRIQELERSWVVQLNHLPAGWA